MCLHCTLTKIVNAPSKWLTNKAPYEGTLKMRLKCAQCVKALQRIFDLRHNVPFTLKAHSHKTLKCDFKPHYCAPSAGLVNRI